MENAKPEVSHSLTLENRSKCAMTGIREVLSYSPREVALSSSNGRLTITGEGLKIVRFNELDGSLSLSGKVNAVRYDEQKPPILKRMFK